MDNVRINTGTKRIMINDDPSRVIEFNPEDVLFAERFYALIKVFDAEQVKYQARVDVIKANEALDEHGIPMNTQETFELVKEACNFLRTKIDEVFGAGTSQAAFGDAQTLGMFEQFFAGVIPLIQTVRNDKVAKYQRTTKTKK